MGLIHRPDSFLVSIDQWRNRLPEEKGGPRLRLQDPALEACLVEWEESVGRFERVPGTLADGLCRRYGENHGSSTGSLGRQTYESISRALASFRVDPKRNVGRSRDQVAVHDRVLKALLPWIYRTEWGKNQEAIMRDHNVGRNRERERVAGAFFLLLVVLLINRERWSGTSLEQFLMVVATRGFGKTICVAEAAAAVAAFMTAPFSVGIYAQNKRTSTDMMNKIYYFLCQIPGVKERIVKYTESGDSPEIELSDGVGGIVLIRALPSGVNNLRGQGFTFTIVEEISFVPEEQLAVGVAPRLQMRDAVFMGITTPSTSSKSIVDTLIDYKYPESEVRIFSTLRFEMRCKACRDANLNECSHVKAETPYWMDERRRVIGMAFCARNRRLFATEFLGASVSGNEPCFEAASIDKLFSPAHILSELPRNLPWVGVFLDPSGGGPSNTGIVSGGYTTDPIPRFVVSLLFFRILSFGGSGFLVVIVLQMDNGIGQDDGHLLLSW